MMELASPPSASVAEAIIESSALRLPWQQRCTALLRFARRQLAQRTGPAALQDAVTTLLETLGAEQGITAWLRPKTSTIDLQVLRLEESGKAVSLLSQTVPADPRSSAAGLAMQRREPIQLSQFFVSASNQDAALTQLGATCGLIVPLLIGETPCGALGVCGTRFRDFDAEETAFTEHLALLVSVAIRKSAEQRSAAALTAAPSAAPSATPIAAPTAAPVDDDPAAAMRSSARKAFHVRQPIAPMYGSVMPTPSQFFEVNCVDISAGGISFYLDRTPDFKTLLVALGREQDPTYFTATVRRCVRECDEHGRTRYLIGCQFMGRVYL